MPHMNSLARPSSRLLVAGCLLALAFAAVAAAPAPKAPADKKPKTATPAEPEIPKSVFVSSASERELHDPFFPNRVGLQPVAPVLPKAPDRPAVAANLQLKGISGPANNRIAIINNQSFKQGEEADVVSGNTRVHVRCIEIRAESAIVEAGGQQRELKLRSGL
jgi:hypothetical protein